MSALPSDPAAELAAAESARQRLAGSLRTPSWFYSSLGVATTVQIGAAAYGLSDHPEPDPQLDHRHTLVSGGAQPRFELWT